MRTYKLLDQEYDDFDTFIAAKRDLAKIESLEKEEGSIMENADMLLAQIYERKLAFETELGNEFLEKIESNAKAFKPKKKVTPEDEAKAEYRSRRNYRVLRAVKKASICFLLCVMAMMGAVLAFNIRSESVGKERFAQLRTLKKHNVGKVIGESTILPEYEQMHEQNPDMVGWLKIDYSSIDYPVVFRANDNDYYLSRNFDGEYDANGMLILDKRCEPNGYGSNMLIHGHNMKSGLMFGSLRKYLDEGYFNDHRIIEYDTLYEKRTYQVISVFISSVDPNSDGSFRYYDYINTDTPTAFDEYVRGVKEASIYQTQETAVFGDKLLTLSTCDYSQNDGRLVVVAKQVIEE